MRQIRNITYGLLTVLALGLVGMATAPHASAAPLPVSTVSEARTCPTPDPCSGGPSLVGSLLGTVGSLLGSTGVTGSGTPCSTPCGPVTAPPTPPPAPTCPVAPTCPTPPMPTEPDMCDDAAKESTSDVLPAMPAEAVAPAQVDTIEIAADEEIPSITDEATTEVATEAVVSSVVVTQEAGTSTGAAVESVTGLVPGLLDGLPTTGLL